MQDWLVFYSLDSQRGWKLGKGALFYDRGPKLLQEGDLMGAEIET